MKTTNIYATIYEGEYACNFDCPGVEACRYVLCSIMPPDGSEKCVFREHGACRSVAAQRAAIEALAKWLKKQLTNLEFEKD